MKPLISIKSLEVGYKNTLLSEVNLTVSSNEIVVIVGENGAGKSTLMKTIAGILKPLSGQVKIQDKSIVAMKAQELAKFQSYVSSNRLPNLMLTVQEFVAFGRYPYMNWLATTSEHDLSLIQKSIVNCRVEHLKHKKLGELSDGEKQKVMLARAFAQETRILMLDEPTSHLDIRNTNALFELIGESKEQYDKSVIFSSHQVEKALSIADKIWLVNQGKVQQCSVAEFRKDREMQWIVFGE